MHRSQDRQFDNMAPPVDEFADIPHVAEDEDDDEELTDAEKDKQAQRCLWMANICLMLSGGACAGVGMYTGFSGHGGAWPGYVVAGVGAFLFVVCFLGFIGALRINRQMLRLYYTCMILGSMANFVMAGFCFLFIKQAKNYLATNWDAIVAAESPATRPSMSLAHEQSVIQRNLIICGAFAVMTLLLALSVTGSVMRLVSKVSGYSILLQSTSITLLPFGAVLIAAGLFIGDSTGAVESPVAAFALFALGLFVIMLSLLGCFGVTIESRGLLRVFMYLVFLLSLGFFAFGILALVQSSLLITNLTNKWNTIRRFLPPTFSGKYDKEQFKIFLETNLLLLGFGALCVGLLLFIQWYASLRLRRSIKEEAELEEFELSFGMPKGAIGYASGHQPGGMSRINSMKVMWKRSWTHGSKKSRTALKCVCTCVVLIFATALTLASLALYFSMSCVEVSDVSDKRTYSNVDMPFLAINNNTRGVTSVTIHDLNQLDVVLTKGAFKRGQENPAWPEVANQTFGQSLTFLPKTRTEILGYDVSCQAGDIQFVMPNATFFGGNTYGASLSSPSLFSVTNGSRASVEYDMSDVPLNLRPRFNHIFANTSSGYVDIFSMLIGANGASLSSDSGDVTLIGVDASCDPDSVGDLVGGVRLSTNLGGISISNSNFTNCDLKAVGSAALISVSNTQSVSAGGGSSISIESEKGFVQMTEVDVCQIQVKSTKGSMAIDSVNAVQIQLATESGKITGTNFVLPVRSVVQAETASGSISLSLKQFAGIVNIVTGGSVTCTGGAFANDPTPCQITVRDGMNHVELQTVNCEDQNDCYYSGAISITSSSGDVSLAVAAWDRNTDPGVDVSCAA